MPPCCAIICLILGIAGMALFCIGFAMPYWVIEAGMSNGSSHGIWQQRECQSGICVNKYIGFGVTSAFEAGRVFCCATIAMAAAAFIFNVIVVKSASRKWAVRTSAMWAMTAMFNLLEAVLIGVTEDKTLEKLAVIGLATHTSMAWSYWMTIGSLGTFVILSISNGVLSCTGEVDDDSKSETSAKKRQHVTAPGSRYMPPEARTSSMLTDKAYPPSVSTFQPPRGSHPLRYGNGFIMQQPASIKVDNQRTHLNALDATHYLTPPRDDYSTMGSGKFILNHPTIEPRVDRFTQPGTSISVVRQGATHQDNVYSFKVGASGIAVPSRDTDRPTPFGQNTMTPNLQVASSNNQVLTLTRDGGPPGYSTLPRDDLQPTVSYLPNIPRIYPNIH